MDVGLRRKNRNLKNELKKMGKALKKQEISNRSGWTPERRAAQSSRLRAARLWERSTGPKTAAGKARSAQNALRTGRHTASRRLFRRICRLQRHTVRNLHRLHSFMARFPRLDHTRRTDSLRRNQHLLGLLMPVFIQGITGDPLLRSGRQIYINT